MLKSFYVHKKLQNRYNFFMRICFLDRKNRIKQIFHSTLIGNKFIMSIKTL